MAGTSKPIASRILNADPTLSVAPALRERLLRVAADLRYRPRAGARSQRRAEAGAVGMLMPSFLNPAHTLIVRGAFRRARERDSTVLLAEDLVERDSTAAPRHGAERGLRRLTTITG